MNSGVYGINSGYVPMIYVGQSQNIRMRLLSHHGDTSHRMWRHNPTQFYYEIVVEGEDARRMRQEELIAEYDPPGNET